MAVLVAAISLVMAHRLEALMPGRVISPAGGALSVGQDERPRGGGVRASGGGFCTRAGDGGPGGGCAGATTVCSLCQDFRICGAMPEGGEGCSLCVRLGPDHSRRPRG